MVTDYTNNFLPFACNGKHPVTTEGSNHKGEECEHQTRATSRTDGSNTNNSAEIASQRIVNADRSAIRTHGESRRDGKRKRTPDLKIVRDTKRLMMTHDKAAAAAASAAIWAKKKAQKCEMYTECAKEKDGPYNREYHKCEKLCAHFARQAKKEKRYDIQKAIGLLDKAWKMSKKVCTERLKVTDQFFDGTMDKGHKEQYDGRVRCAEKLKSELDNLQKCKAKTKSHRYREKGKSHRYREKGKYHRYREKGKYHPYPQKSKCHPKKRKRGKR